MPSLYCIYRIGIGWFHSLYQNMSKQYWLATSLLLALFFKIVSSKWWYLFLMNLLSLVIMVKFRSIDVCDSTRYYSQVSTYFQLFTFFWILSNLPLPLSSELFSVIIFEVIADYIERCPPFSGLSSIAVEAVGIKK